MSEKEQPQSGFRLWMLIPALGAAMVLAVFLLGLQRDDVQRLPSALIDKPVPAFTLEPLEPDQPGLSDADLKTPGVKLLNIWASWCGPCRVEHPQIMALAEGGVTVHGLNYKDKDANAKAFLAELGDPYSLIGADRSGRTGIEFGVYGVPESFLVDKAGRIVCKHIGAITEHDLETKLLPAIRAAKAGETVAC